MGRFGMEKSSYEFDEEYRRRIDAEICSLALKFHSGELGVIAVSRELRRYRTVVEKKSPELAAVLMTFVAVDSETDALPIGRIRERWHPSTIDIEDQKIQKAESMYCATVNSACEKILRILA